MWIEYTSTNSLGSIKSAVFFGKRNKFFPYDCLTDTNFPGDYRRLLKRDITSPQLATGISYHGFVDNNLSSEFFKYGYKKLGKELRKIDDLGENTKTLMGLSVAEDCLFPTVYNLERTADTRSYFKSSRLDDKLLFFIDVPENCGSIELYDQELDESSVIRKLQEFGYRKCILGSDNLNPEPVVIIKLGPDPSLLNNTDSMYFTHDARLFFEDEHNRELYGTYGYENYTRKTKVGDEEYIKLCDEFKSPGLLVFVISGGEISTLNLSYISWVNDSEPNKIQAKTMLKTQEYYSNVYKKDPSKEKGDCIVDVISGSMLGIKKVEKTPILAKRSIQKDLLGYFDYSPSKEYSIGDKVKYQGKHWVSCYNGNIGHFPQISNKWVLESCIEKSLNNIIFIDTVHSQEHYRSAEDCTKLSKRILSVPERNIELGVSQSVIIYCTSKYMVDKDSIYYYTQEASTGKSEKISLKENEDFIYYDESGQLILNSAVLEKLAGNTLKIGVVPILPCKYEVRFIFNDKIYTYSQWRDTFGGIKCTKDFDGTGESKEKGEEIELAFEYDSNKYNIDKVTAVCEDSRSFSLSNDVELLKRPSIEEDGDTFKFTIKPDTEKTVYYIEVSREVFSIEVVGGEDFEISNWYTEVYKGEAAVVKLYPVDSSISYKVTVGNETIEVNDGAEYEYNKIPTSNVIIQIEEI